MKRKQLLVWLVTGAQLISASTVTIAQEHNQVLLGFSPQETVAQLSLESKLDSLLDKSNLEQWMRRLSARPHHVGSPYGKANAEFIHNSFLSWGFDSRIEEFLVLFPTPKTRVLKLLEPEVFEAALQEPTLDQDSTSGQKDEQLPSYNAYSVDGDVTGELVYVNYGVPQDYEVLRSLGIDVQGKIVIARYGGSWRGIKPKVAAEKGAIGCILYSDPRDDGFFRGPVYPEGAFRPAEGVQRGSVADMPTYPGDPLTPGRGAVKDAERLALNEAATLTKIPVLPISHQDALPLLRNLQGPTAPAAWRGALPITYRLGPGPARVNLRLEFNWDLVPAYNVIAQLAGSERPDQWIMRGNHHDAWVNGARDPLSGMVALMEEARAIAQLAKEGWKPKRTIVYAAWDAEEPGLIGSTEWVEQHADLLRKQLAVYINTDGNGRGFLRAGGSHTLEPFINQVAQAVKDPQTGVSVWRRWQARNIESADREAAADIRSRPDLRISALGSGSDYSPFLQHLGAASLNLSFRGEDAGGSYHSIYDSLNHYSQFTDPGFDYGVALAATAGRAVLRLAAAPVLPFYFGNFAETVSRYVKEVKELIDTMRLQTQEDNLRLEAGTGKLAADPRQAYVAPVRRSEVPQFDFAPLEKAVEQVEASARRFDETSRRLSSSQSASQQQRLDKILMSSERALTRHEGLPGRPWYIHHIYAPGFYTGYGVKTLPAVREAIEQRQWDQLPTQIENTAAVLKAFSKNIDQALKILEEQEPS